MIFQLESTKAEEIDVPLIWKFLFQIANLPPHGDIA
jgi:hypothetical protein